MSILNLNFKSKFIQTIISSGFSIIAVFLFVFILVKAADTWTPPPGIPPTCPIDNPACNSPINVGTSTQYKMGALGIGGVFSADSLAVFNNKVGIGTTEPSATLEVNGTMKIFAGWETKIYGQIYQAKTDGFVIASGYGAYDTHANKYTTMQGFSDENPNPTTQRAIDRANSYGGVNVYSSITFPVKKGDYWKITGSDVTTAYIYWMALGQYTGGDLYVGIHSSSDCANLNGTVVNDNDIKFCKFSGASCPSGWTKYKNYSTTRTNSCFVNIYDGCKPNSCDPPRGCNTGFHPFNNTSIETCGYYNQFPPNQACQCFSASCTAIKTEIGCY